MEMDGVAALVILIVLVSAIYFIPTFIALARDHEYRWVIFALNALGGWTFLLWAVALIWAVYPRDRLFVDPLVGAATGFKSRNVGDVVGEAAFGQERGYAVARNHSSVPSINASGQLPQADQQANLLDTLERLQRLRDSGAISTEEFDAQKREAMRRVSF